MRKMFPWLVAVVQARMWMNVWLGLTIHLLLIKLAKCVILYFHFCSNALLYNYNGSSYHEMFVCFHSMSRCIPAYHRWCKAVACKRSCKYMYSNGRSDSILRYCLTIIGIPIIKIRRSHYRPILIMEIPILLMTSSNGSIFRVTGPLCGEFTGHRWIPLTKASDAELWVFLSFASEQKVKHTIDTPVIWDAITLIITSL